MTSRVTLLVTLRHTNRAEVVPASLLPSQERPMPSRFNWDRLKTNPRGSEEASPRGKRHPRRGGSHVQPGPVKTWADMSPEERARVEAELLKPGRR